MTKFLFFIVIVLVVLLLIVTWGNKESYLCKAKSYFKSGQDCQVQDGYHKAKKWVHCKTAD